jgi:hypothetical protein
MRRGSPPITVAFPDIPDFEKSCRARSARTGSLSIHISIPSGARAAAGDIDMSSIVMPITSTRLAPRTFPYITRDCTLVAL